MPFIPIFYPFTLFYFAENAPYLKYLDPSGAIIIGIYIVYSWWKMGAGKLITTSFKFIYWNVAA